MESFIGGIDDVVVIIVVLFVLVVAFNKFVQFCFFLGGSEPRGFETWYEFEDREYAATWWVTGALLVVLLIVLAISSIFG